jgi:hypothetical protein
VVGAKGSPIQLILAGIYHLMRRPATSRSGPHRAAKSVDSTCDPAARRQLPRLSNLQSPTTSHSTLGPESGGVER